MNCSDKIPINSDIDKWTHELIQINIWNISALEGSRSSDLTKYLNTFCLSKSHLGQRRVWLEAQKIKMFLKSYFFASAVTEIFLPTLVSSILIIGTFYLRKKQHNNSKCELVVCCAFKFVGLHNIWAMFLNAINYIFICE